MGTPSEVRRTLNRISNMVANGQIDSKQANAIIYISPLFREDTNAIAVVVSSDEYGNESNLDFYPPWVLSRPSPILKKPAISTAEQESLAMKIRQ